MKAYDSIVVGAGTTYSIHKAVSMLVGGSPEVRLAFKYLCKEES
jgi:hypothetical protein